MLHEQRAAEIAQIIITAPEGDRARRGRFDWLSLNSCEEDVVLLKRTALCTFCKFVEALNVRHVEWT